jgi:hypothetical protein
LEKGWSVRGSATKLDLITLGFLKDQLGQIEKRVGFGRGADLFGQPLNAIRVRYKTNIPIAQWSGGTRFGGRGAF